MLQAVWKDFLPGMQLLIDSGADVNQANPGGWTPLIQAGYSDRLEAAKLLLATNAAIDKKGKDSDGTYKTALEFAEKKNKNSEMSKLLRQAEAESKNKVETSTGVGIKQMVKGFWWIVYCIKEKFK